ncbi:uncharacterized protein LOC111085696 isoform X2 [Limulus polyphemus]|uniref:Uncharacterized protein LOC111085696 isoform X2 n=1 Tax=Limulus polyphemus TaxID=6850 RepID=A0ABM1SC75_LIMPO|nr:uncharacterized protein LOC111085696 isoform X2 [Limulus polyphemus]
MESIINYTISHVRHQPVFLTNESTIPKKQESSRMSNWWRDHLQVVPEWSQVSEHFQWSWQLHVYGLACLFLVLTCVAFFAILSLRAQLLARPNLSTLNVFLCLLGASRALGLFIDPYGSKEIMPEVITYILWDLAFPSLLSAFSLLHLAFQQVTQVKLVPSRLGNEMCVSVVITSHFCLVISSDILWTLQNSLRMVWLVTQALFTAWGVYLCTVFFCKCLILLRSLAKLPTVFLSRADSTSYDNKGVISLGKLTKQGDSSSNGGLTTSCPKSTRFTPKIRITDENEQTFSYVSDTSQHNSTDVPVSDAPADKHPAPCCNIRMMFKHTDGCDSPRVCPSSPKLRKSSPNHLLGSPITSRDTIIQCQPLMDCQIKEFKKSHRKQSDLEELGPILPKTQQMAPSSPTSSTKGNDACYISTRDDFQFDAHKLKPNKRSNIEKLLRKMVLAAVLGLVVCVLQVYQLVGPHGLSSKHRNAAIVPWFCYQTVYRIIEFLMGCILATITKQSLHPHCCHLYSHTDCKWSNSVFS